MQIGSKLKNSAIVLAFKCEDNKYIVLAKWENRPLEYVTWRFDEQENTYLGHYFHDKEDAVADFHAR